MRDIFYINDKDSSRVIKIKTEANIKLASVALEYKEGSREFDKEYQLLNKVVETVSYLDYVNIVTKEDTKVFLNHLIVFYTTGILSPLTLEDDEFKLDDDNFYFTVLENIRYPYITKNIDKRGVINIINYINYKAFNCVVKAMYDHIDKKEIFIYDKYIPLYGPKVYITKGGVVTGEYIKFCEINKNKINELDVSNIIDLPISIIHHSQISIYTVDHREPALKTLANMYNLVMDFTSEYKGLYDIRKYTKLNK